MPCDRHHRLEHIWVLHADRWADDWRVWLETHLSVALGSWSGTQEAQVSLWPHQVRVGSFSVANTLKEQSMHLFWKPQIFDLLIFLLNLTLISSSPFCVFTGLQQWQVGYLLWAKLTLNTLAHMTWGWRCGEEKTSSSLSGWVHLSGSPTPHSAKLPQCGVVRWNSFWKC